MWLLELNNQSTELYGLKLEKTWILSMPPVSRSNSKNILCTPKIITCKWPST